MVFSASTIMADIRWGTPYKFFLKQIVWVVLGFIAMFTTGFLIDYEFYRKYSKCIYLFSLILTIAVLFIGVSRLGAKRWISIGPLTMQPSELTKISMAMIIADFISRKKYLMKDWKGLLSPSIIVFIALLPIVMEPDLGTPILIVMLCFAMLFCAGIKIEAVFTGVITVCILAIEESIREPYRLKRVKDYFASFVNIDKSS
jgi:cell division protein FtsW